MSIVFEDIHLHRILINFDYGTTVQEMLMKYLQRIEKPELFNTDKIEFHYNSKKFNWFDNTKIEQKFNFPIGIPSIFVNNVGNSNF